MLKHAKLGESVFMRNLLIYPIQGSIDVGISVASIDDVLDDMRGEFCELDTPDINRISFCNRGDTPVLMLDGEEIIGSLQNRIIADSTFVDAHMTSSIPVICAEEGRWSELGTFKTGYCSYPGIRAILSRQGKRENGAQKKVWKEIERKLTITKTLSTTSSMHDIYNNLDDEVTRYVEDFSGLNHNTIGFIGVAGNKILGCDLFSDPSTYRHFEHKLLRSYALDAIEHRKPSGGNIDTEDFLQDINNSLDKKKFSTKTHHFTLRGDSFSGQGINYRNRIIHLSAFPK